jgi:hypothetical protein
MDKYLFNYGDTPSGCKKRDFVPLMSKNEQGETDEDYRSLKTEDEFFF